MTDRTPIGTGAPPRPDMTTNCVLTDGGGRERVLIPLPILEGQGVPGGLPELLSTTDVILLGYHVVPEQTPPDMMRQQYEEQAQKSLSEVAETFANAGGEAETRLVFTHDREQTVDRVLAETGATAFLLPRPIASVDSVLVPLRGDVDAARIARFVARLRGDRDIDVTLYAATGEGEDAAAAAAAELVDLAAATLTDLGVPADAITERAEVTDTPTRAIIRVAIAHDAVVMGKREPDWRSLIFGELHEQIADESLGPVFVVGDVGE
ncbi:universal stress protein [Haloparvum alkalitolerans]|uniref:universal stress protein n=1 Tax=Haloparvum alkalitolerans TaxID=1042953 RepID=UPI003CEC87A4